MNDDCPPPTKLTEFLQGLLQPPELTACESHVADCERCHETLRGLQADDTMSQYVGDAFAVERPGETEDDVVDSLIDRLQQSLPVEKNEQPRKSATATMLADRAAEVLRRIEPTDDGALGQIGDYRIERLIGAGSSGVVFYAVDQNLHRAVALKVLRPSLGSIAHDRFMAEARAAASIEHPNVVTIFQVGETDDLAWIAMQWVEGQTLEEYLLGDPELTDDWIRSVAIGVAAGLAAAHEKFLIHRDIKPANVWIGDDGETFKILDFGLARIADDNPGLTATGMLAGTPNFMSPEQARGRQLDPRSDLFSLGCILYRLLTGALPFGDTTVLGTIESIRHHQPPVVSQIMPSADRELADIAMWCLEKEPVNRPESAAMLIETLTQPRNRWPVPVKRYLTSPVEEVASPAVSTSDSFWRRGLAAAVLLGLLGGGWMFGGQLFRIATNQGEIVIEAEEGVEVEVSQNGEWSVFWIRLPLSRS